MDFDEALKAHVAWKMSLSAYVRDPDGSLRLTTVTDETACDLGKWILGEAATLYGQDGAYAELKASHTAFHRAAAQLVRKAHAGEDVFQETLLGSGSDYALSSSEVVRHLIGMKMNHLQEHPS
jgi:hypothetical protein